MDTRKLTNKKPPYDIPVLFPLHGPFEPKWLVGVAREKVLGGYGLNGGWNECTDEKIRRALQNLNGWYWRQLDNQQEGTFYHCDGILIHQDADLPGESQVVIATVINCDTREEAEDAAEDWPALRTLFNTQQSHA